MTHAEHEEMCRRFANCAAYNQTDGIKLAAYLLDGMIGVCADPLCPTCATLKQAAERLRAFARERERSP